MPATEAPASSTEHGSQLRVAQLLRPYWKTLSIAGVAVIGETLTDILEPWPVKVIVDSVLQSKPLKGWVGAAVFKVFGHEPLAVLNFAVAAVVVIAVVGAISSYVESYFTNSVSQWVAHDLRRTLYHHIQRLSLSEHTESRTGDLISRVTKDTDAVQEFINSALLGIVVDLLTLGGMIAVMFYLDWRFTLMALLVAPVTLAASMPVIRVTARPVLVWAIMAPASGLALLAALASAAKRLAPAAWVPRPA